MWHADVEDGQGVEAREIAFGHVAVFIEKFHNTTLPGGPIAGQVQHIGCNALLRAINIVMDMKELARPEPRGRRGDDVNAGERGDQPVCAQSGRREKWRRSDLQFRRRCETAAPVKRIDEMICAWLHTS